jgi:hypothetical protein
MNLSTLPSSAELASRRWRWGIGLTLLAVLYVTAVVAFIIIY